jgi:protein TonB
MFDGFEKRTDRQTGGRFLASTGASLGAYAFVGAAFVLAASGQSAVVKPKDVDVVFRPLPAAAPVAAPLPAPKVPQELKVKRVAAVALPRPVALVEPVNVPDEKPAEADPATDAVEVAALAGESLPGSAIAGVGVGPGGSGIAPVRQPINLPEHATPPVPHDGNASPEYPEDARRRGLEGQVILKVVVSETGEVVRVDVLRGDEPFVTAAVRTVRSWRYSPALVDGQPAAVFRIVKIPFQLRR